MEPQDKTAVYTSIFIFFAGISAVGMLIPRYDTLPLGIAYFTAFTGYFWVCKFPPSFKSILAIGVLVRVLLFVGLPALSDDFYRFLWDGNLLDSGVSPFAQLPSEIAKSGDYPAGTSSALFDQLNSKDYFTIYPPINQFVFWLSVTLTDSWLTSANIIRSFLLIADIGAFVLLRKIFINSGKNTQLSNWYFLNPLVILEGVGNLHFEVLVIFFLLGGIYFFQQSKTFKSGISLGLAIGTKLLPLIFLPAFLFSTSIKKGFWVCLIAFVLAIISFIPMIDESLVNGMTSSLGLYFQKFEFNGSIYFLIREVGFIAKGYNIIGTLGPALSIITLVGVLAIAILGKIKQWPVYEVMLWSLTIYLFLATTVHPWYILPLIALGLLSGFIYPIVWSLMVFVSYFGYTNTGFELSPIWIVLEYIVVIITLGIELYKKSDAQNS
ncbi:MAG: glycosyltransferase 87 family protein [Marinoscillum sp.]